MEKIRKRTEAQEEKQITPRRNLGITRPIGGKKQKVDLSFICCKVLKMGKQISVKQVILTSFFVDFLDIAVNIFVALITGSVVMLAELLQGVSDLIASGLLLIGLSKSIQKLKAHNDQKHICLGPYGSKRCPCGFDCANPLPDFRRNKIRRTWRHGHRNNPGPTIFKPDSKHQKQKGESCKQRSLSRFSYPIHNMSSSFSYLVHLKMMLFAYPGNQSIQRAYYNHPILTAGIKQTIWL